MMNYQQYIQQFGPAIAQAAGSAFGGQQQQQQGAAPQHLGASRWGVNSGHAAAVQAAPQEEGGGANPMQAIMGAFGGGTPGIVPGEGQPPAMGGQAPVAQAPQEQGGAFGSGQHPNIPGAMQAQPQAQSVEKPKNAMDMRMVFEDSSEEEREELANMAEQSVPGGDVVKAATDLVESNPQAKEYGLPWMRDGKFDRQEAGAFLFEWGLRMMKASGSGEGNVFSDIGDSALGAMESRRAFHTEQEAKGDRSRQREREDTEFGWKKEDRPGEVDETKAERERRAAEETRREEEEARRKEAHEKAQKKGDWTRGVNEDNEYIWEDPNTGMVFKSGERAHPSERRGDRGPTAFEVEWEFFRNANVPGGEKAWKKLSAEEQSRTRGEFLKWKKRNAGMDASVLRLEMQVASEMAESDLKLKRSKSYMELMQMAREELKRTRPELYRDEEGFSPDWAQD